MRSNPPKRERKTLTYGESKPKESSKEDNNSKNEGKGLHFRVGCQQNQKPQKENVRGRGENKTQLLDLIVNLH